MKEEIIKKYKEEIKEILKKLKENISIVSIEEEHLLLDYITNLQERFNALLEAHKIADELETEYQERNEKAIEYIEEHIKYECDDTFNGMSFYSYHLYDFKKDDLLNILKGDKDE